MLSSLEIHNILLIEKISINFANGLNVFTGETGAGKSILLIKKTKPEITTKPRINLMIKPMIFVLVELVFLLNCI